MDPPDREALLIPILGALGPGTPVAFEAAYGWGRKSSSSLMATSGGAVRLANAVTATQARRRPEAPYRMICIDLHKRLFLLVTGRGE
jgi:hypothetical protein